MDVVEFGADAYAHREQVDVNNYLTRCRRCLGSVEEAVRVSSVRVAVTVQVAVTVRVPVAVGDKMP